MSDDEERDSVRPPPPPAPPKGDMGSLKKAQGLLKGYGYTLTAFGPYRVSFYRTATQRTKEGLVPEEDWYNLTPKRFGQFLAQLGRDDSE